MKEFYFAKNSYTGNYVFYEGKKEHNRREFSAQKGIESILKDLSLDFKRKSFFYIKDLSDEEVSKIRKYLKKTKIQIEKTED